LVWGAYKVRSVEGSGCPVAGKAPAAPCCAVSCFALNGFLGFFGGFWLVWWVLVVGFLVCGVGFCGVLLGCRWGVSLLVAVPAHFGVGGSLPGREGDEGCVPVGFSAGFAGEAGRLGSPSFFFWVEGFEEFFPRRYLSTARALGWLLKKRLERGSGEECYSGSGSSGGLAGKRKEARGRERTGGGVSWGWRGVYKGFGGLVCRPKPKGGKRGNESGRRSLEGGGAGRPP